LDPRTGAITALTENLDPAGLAWSPDGETLAFLTQVTGPAIRVMRPDGRQMRTVMDAGPRAPKLIFGFSRPTWSSDGTRLAFAAAHLSNEGVCKGEPTDPPVLEPPPWCSQSHVFTLDLERGVPRELTDGVVVDLDPAWSPDGSGIAFVRFDWTKADSREGLGSICCLWTLKIALSGASRLPTGSTPAGWRGPLTASGSFSKMMGATST
jgi:Tol biopolymer transport system component